MLPVREDLILPLVTGKRVLDCGGIDHGAAAQKLANGEWLHALIADRAAECIGVDILEANVERVNRQGNYRFVAANVERLPFQDEFDVVVAGELVEHVYNAGLFLDSAWRALRSNGKLVLTTPNAYALSFFAHNLLKGKEHCHPEHICYYSAQTLSHLVSRHGFSIDKMSFVTRPARTRRVRYARRLVEALRPSLAEKLVLIATKTDKRLGYEGVW